MLSNALFFKLYEKACMSRPFLLFKVLRKFLTDTLLVGDMNVKRQFGESSTNVIATFCKKYEKF